MKLPGFSLPKPSGEGVTVPFLSAAAVQRLCIDLIGAEQQRLLRERRISSRQRIETYLAGRHPDEERLLGICEDALGLDSLMLLDVVGVVSRYFALADSGAEDLLLVHRTLGDWSQAVVAHFERVGAGARIVFETSGSAGEPPVIGELVAHEVERPALHRPVRRLNGDPILRSHSALRTGAADLSKRLAKEKGAIEAGTEALGRGLSELETVKGSIESVAQITEVLRDIAVQTNLLAFNAAIEAARAGEHGIGFSVVADDVRKLAEGNSVAARDIARLLQSLTEALARGRQTATQTLGTVSEAAVGIAAGVDCVAGLVGECDLQVRATDAIAELVDRVRATAAQ